MTSQDERVSELESRVERLEATVRGLTEELVEATGRIEELEGSRSGESTGKETRQQVEESKAEAFEDANETEPSERDDIIVA